MDVEIGINVNVKNFQFSHVDGLKITLHNLFRSEGTMFIILDQV